MARSAIKKYSLTKDTLLKLAQAGVFVIAASTSPFFLTRFIEQYFKEKTKKAAWRRTTLLKSLRKKRMVSFEDMPDGTIRIELTQEGRKWVRRYKLDDLAIKKPKKWDGKWRLIFYDIPEYNKEARRALSTKLHELGLYQFQKSLWISAYECIGELEFVCAVFNINMNDHIFYLETQTIPKEEEMRRWFRI